MAALLQLPKFDVTDLEGFLTLLHPDDGNRIGEGLQQLKIEGGQLSLECRSAISEDSPQFLHLQAKYNSNQESSLLIFGTIQDVTEQHHLQEEASRATHLAALGELSAGIGHEINNPTGVILMDIPIIQKAFADIAPLLEEHYCCNGTFPFAGLPYPEMRDEILLMLDDMRGNAQRIKRIVDELRDFSRPTEDDKGMPVDLNLLVRKALPLLSHQIKNTTDCFQVNYAEQEILVLGEFNKLEQVVVNLVLNACQSLSERSQKVVVTITTKGDRQLLIVKDEGVGIPAEQLAMISSPFFTTRRNEGGTGLGLSVSARIVEQHDGQLHFASTTTQGTCVTMSLPIWQEKENP